MQFGHFTEELQGSEGHCMHLLHYDLSDSDAVTVSNGIGNWVTQYGICSL